MNLRQLRQKRGLTQAQLAAAAGIDQTAVSQIELGKVLDPRWSTITSLSAALRISPVRLMEAVTDEAA